MIAHVAEVGEERGRVVLWLDCCAWPNDATLAAAVQVARAFQSEIESLIVEDAELLDLASFPFAQEVALSGRSVRPLSAVDMEREMSLAVAALQREIDDRMHQANVPHRFRTERGEPLALLEAACIETGPWNVVVIANPAAAVDAAALKAVFERVSGMTGVVIAGPGVDRVTGRLVAIIEEIERLPSMLRAAERLASASRASITLLLASPREDFARWMEGQVRLALGDRVGSELETEWLIACDASDFTNALIRLKPGFVVAQFDGRAFPASAAEPTATVRVGCPLLLVR